MTEGSRSLERMPNFGLRSLLGSHGLHFDSARTAPTTVPSQLPQSPPDRSCERKSFYFVTGEDSSSFEISSSGALAFVNTPSYNSKKEYSLTVNVSDGLSSDSLILSVYVDRLCTDTLIGFNVCLEGESDGGVSYNRDNDYDTWKDWDNDCQSNRHEVLESEHIDDDSNHPIVFSSDGCFVNSGKWFDPYDNLYYFSS